LPRNDLCCGSNNNTSTMFTKQSLLSLVSDNNSLPHYARVYASVTAGVLE